MRYTRIRALASCSVATTTAEARSCSARPSRRPPDARPAPGQAQPQPRAVAHHGVQPGRDRDRRERCGSSAAAARARGAAAPLLVPPDERVLADDALPRLAPRHQAAAGSKASRPRGIALFRTYGNRQISLADTRLHEAVLVG